MHAIIVATMLLYTLLWLACWSEHALQDINQCDKILLTQYSLLSSMHYIHKPHDLCAAAWPLVWSDTRLQVLRDLNCIVLHPH